MRNHAAAQLLDLHVTDWAALDLLDWTGPIGIGELATQLGMSAAAATAMVDRLAARGLVERAPHPGDRRRVVVRPTGDRGPDYRRINEDLERAMACHARAFTAQELATVLRFMEGASAVLTGATEHLRDEARQQ